VREAWLVTHLRMHEREEGSKGTNISGDFCVSITAATGIPKFETGPQKSVEYTLLSAVSFYYESRRLEAGWLRVC